MKSIRCGRGLGDSLYLQAVVRLMLAKNTAISFKVKSDYPDVFSQLGNRVSVVPFDRNVDITAHYSVRKGVPGTTQWQDCCIAAGISRDSEMHIDWRATNTALVEQIKAPGKPIVVVQMPRPPMGRTDGFGASLLPDCSAIQRLIREAKTTHTVVQIGAGKNIYTFDGIDFDLSNRTTVADALDVASVADRFLGYCSFLVPMAESFSRPALFVWSHRGLRDPQPFVRRITPQKVLHKPTSRFVMDNATEAQLLEAWHALR